MGVDLSDFNRAARRLNKDVEKELVKTQARVIIHVATGLNRITPVDTGETRSHWQAEEGTPPVGSGIGFDSAIHNTDNPASGLESLLQMVSVANAVKPYSDVYVGNPLEHISVLDGGSSAQAPAGILAPVLASVRQAFT